jgi:hypothetical protein
MTPADLRRLHKYMLEIEKVSFNEMRTVVETDCHEAPVAGLREASAG